MVKQPSVKILVGYHKPAQLLKSDILVPIHLGRALATQASKDGMMSAEDYQWMLDNMIGDDTGDNISHLNRYFCELTAIYWAWKNYDKLGNPDYVGFCHYRRFLDFSEQYQPDVNNCHDLVLQKVLSQETRNLYENHTQEIIKQISQTDIIHGCLTKYNFSVYDQFKDLENPQFGLKTSIFYDILDIMKQKFPTYAKAIDIYSKSKSHYWYNCFVMKKKYFFEYCDFIFSILLGYEKQIDFTTLNLNGQRILAYISERILGFYLTQKQLEKKKIEYKPIIFVENTDALQNITPAYSKDNIAIVLSSDDNYVPYLAVCLKSIIQNISNHNYDICILNDGMKPENKQKIKNMELKNVSIRFISVTSLLNNIGDLFYIYDHFSVATYYRFFIPELFNNYSKILYLDCDMIIQEDVAELYNTDLQESYIAAVRDVEMFRACYNDYYYGSNWTQYLTDTLKMKKTSDYFQAGVMLFDIKKLNTFNFREKCIRFLSSIRPIYVDQCIMNHVLQGHVKYLDYKWNVQWQIPIYAKIEQCLPISLYEQYKASLESPKIIHYAGRVKPWSAPYLQRADIWWQYARMTPFYEEILYNNTKNNQDFNFLLLDVKFHPLKYKLKKLIYKFKKKFYKNSKKEKYIKRYNEIKFLIKSAKNRKGI
jgi:lipopolysaccharide biosynthesis glycosyltransferase